MERYKMNNFFRFLYQNIKIIICIILAFVLILTLSLHISSPLQSKITGKKWDVEFSPLDDSIKFNKTIWQTSKAQIDSNQREWMDSWKNFENWEHRVLNDESVYNFIKKKSNIDIERVKKLNKVLLFDIFRYMIVFEYGGIYADSDVELVKTKDIIRLMNLGCKFIGGVENDDRESETGLLQGEPHFGVNQWSFYTTQGHPVFETVIENVNSRLEDFLKTGEDKITDVDVLRITGPGVWGDSIKEYIEKKHGTNMYEDAPCGNLYKIGDVCIAPVKVFSPDKDRFCSTSTDNQMQFIKHHYYGSWRQDK
jgi:alpha 1,6-mannosyltransferase